MNNMNDDMNNNEIKKEIINKCIFEHNFTNFTNFWKDKLGCSFKDIGKSSYFIIIDKKVIDNMVSCEKIPVDCRCFAMLYSELENILEYGKGTILMHHDISAAVEIVPDDCFYLKLSNKLDEKVSNTQLRSVLDDKQGQWIVKTSANTYIGITSEKIIEATLNDWYLIYHSAVVKKLEELKNLQQNHINDNVDKNISIKKKAMFGILSINIKKYGLEYSLINFKHVYNKEGVSWYQVVNTFVPTTDCSENSCI